jgi:hypothetical protein
MSQTVVREKSILSVRRGQYPIHSQNTLRRFLVGTESIPVRYRMRLYAAVVTQLQLWHFHLLLSVHTVGNQHEQVSWVIFNVAACILKIHLLSHTNKCTNYIIYYLKSVLIIDIKTLPYFRSSYVFRHITCHPQGALMFLAKNTGKTICKT